MVYPTDEETFDARDTPEFIAEGHLNSIQQLLKRIQDFLGYGGRLHDEGGLVTPVGIIAPYCGDSAPSGWLKCDGSAVHSSTYADLFAVIGYKYGKPFDQEVLFNLPDFRGMFLRGSSKITTFPFTTTDVDTTDDYITALTNDFNRSGLPIRFTTTGTLPAPFLINTTYYIIVGLDDKCYFATTRANAIANTQIDITTVGVGNSIIVPYLNDDKDSRLALSIGGETGEDIGSFQPDAFQGHKQQLDVSGYAKVSNGNVGYGWSGNTFATTDVTPDNPLVVSGSYGTPRLSVETRPKNVGVNFIIKR